MSLSRGRNRQIAIAGIIAVLICGIAALTILNVGFVPAAQTAVSQEQAAGCPNTGMGFTTENVNGSAGCATFLTTQTAVSTEAVATCGSNLKFAVNESASGSFGCAEPSSLSGSYPYGNLSGTPTFGNCGPNKVVVNISSSGSLTCGLPPVRTEVTKDQTNTANSAKNTTAVCQLTPNTNYSLTSWFYVTSVSSATMNFQFHTLPSGASAIIGAYYWCSTCNVVGSGIVGSSGSNFLVTPAANSPYFVQVFGSIQMGATAGKFQLDFLNPAAVGTITIKANSWILCTPQTN